MSGLCLWGRGVQRPLSPLKVGQCKAAAMRAFRNQVADDLGAGHLERTQ